MDKPMNDQQKECLRYILENCFESTTDSIPEGVKPSEYTRYIMPTYDVADILKNIYEMLKLECPIYMKNHLPALLPDAQEILENIYPLYHTPRMSYGELKRCEKVLTSILALKHKLEREAKINALDLDM